MEIGQAKGTLMISLPRWQLTADVFLQTVLEAEREA